MIIDFSKYEVSLLIAILDEYLENIKSLIDSDYIETEDDKNNIHFAHHLMNDIKKREV